ncbi:MAG TPA: hypothetical protein DCP08_06310 [Chloroflexi bacterium]|nr:hypothetical protein [Chloroflexota bacterium]
MSVSIGAYRLVLVIQREEPKAARMARLERAYRHQRLKEVRERERRRMEEWGRLLGCYPIL